MIKFIIHADSYAGNFERELCAFITGQIGECGVGSKYVEECVAQKYEPYVLQVLDDRQVERPVQICPNPKYSNNGIGYHYDATDMNACIEAQKKYIEYLTEEKLKELQESLDFYKDTKHNTDYYEEEIASLKEEIANYAALPANEIPSYPAYNSVCIFISDDTPESVIEEFKERAHQFKGEFTIEDFEVIDASSTTATPLTKGEELKVKVVAYKEHLIIETQNPNTFDKDFSPNNNSRMGCTLSNVSKLGISLEALELLNQIKPNRDAIGDLMWNSESFSWLGGPLTIKDTKAQGDRSFSVQSSYIEIPNEVSEEQKDAVEEAIKPNEIDYNDIEANVCIEFQQIDRDKPNSDYNVNVIFHDTHLYSGETVLNAPTGYVKICKDSTDIKATKEFKEKILAAIDSYIPNLQVPQENLMDILNRLFELGFSNNIMRPSADYWRLTHELSYSEYLSLWKKISAE